MTDVDAPSVEIRVKPCDGGGWAVEVRRGGNVVYARVWNKTADEAWEHARGWLHEDTRRAK